MLWHRQRLMPSQVSEKSMNAWITVVGIGEDGMEGLSSECIAIIKKAEVLITGERHLSKVDNSEAEILDWRKGFNHALKELEARRGKNIVVLASGDPMNFSRNAGFCVATPTGQVSR